MCRGTRRINRGHANDAPPFVRQHPIGASYGLHCGGFGPHFFAENVPCGIRIKWGL
jgi:hypothetical protein